MSPPDTDPQFGETAEDVPPEEYVPDKPVELTVKDVSVLLVIVLAVDAKFKPDGVIPLTVTSSPIE